MFEQCGFALCLNKFFLANMVLSYKFELTAGISMKMILFTHELTASAGLELSNEPVAVNLLKKIIIH